MIAACVDSPRLCCCYVTCGLVCRASAGLKAVFGCNGAVWIGQDDRGCLQEEQVRAASELAHILHSSVSQGAVIKPDCMHIELT